MGEFKQNEAGIERTVLFSQKRQLGHELAKALREAARTIPVIRRGRWATTQSVKGRN